MKRLLFTFCSVLIMVSCNTKETESKETAHDFVKDRTTLYVSRVGTPNPDSKQIKKLDELTPVKDCIIKIVTANHIEISLNERANKSGYLALKNVKGTTSDIGNSGTEYISDWCGAAPTFKTADGFLSFMSARGYKLTSQADNTHGKDYVFDKI